MYYTVTVWSKAAQYKNNNTQYIMCNTQFAINNMGHTICEKQDAIHNMR